jgi:bacterioferritin-associated ferredoxin
MAANLHLDIQRLFESTGIGSACTRCNQMSVDVNEI